MVISRRRILRAIGLAASHLGLLLGLVGIVLNQRLGSSGAVTLTLGAGAVDYRLSRDRQRIELLPFALTLDSMTTLSAKGFMPTTIAWVVTGRKVFPIYLNHPLLVAGQRVMFVRTVPSGFPLELLVRLGADEFLLLYQQRVRLADGEWFSSFGYEPATQSIGLELGEEQFWLRAGEDRTVSVRAGASSIRRPLAVSLLDVRLAAQPGVILLVNDAQFTPVIFAGFGLMLLGIALVFFGRGRG